MKKIKPPFYPIIYIRGFAMTQSAVEETVATPYMGFNLGSTKIRQEWDGEVKRHIFESPLIRLMKDFGYVDNYSDGLETEGDIPAKSIIIHRYYEQADSDIGSGDGVPSIEEAAGSLSELILKTRDQVCGDDSDAKSAFRVYLVAHSMGGLIARCLLQNDKIGSKEAKSLVDKVFTYGTPHNGIEIRGVNVPRFLGGWDINNFNRRRIAEYLQLSGSLGSSNGDTARPWRVPGDESNRVDTLDGKFPESRFFCHVGTNHEDYNLSRYAVGPMSDGLVLIKNASIQGAPRTYTHHSHSGHYGLVNSEEGYQNLTRFLFGDVRVTGRMLVRDLPLPPSVRKAHEDGREIRASYLFECTVMTRGARFRLSDRRIDNNSAVFRKFEEMFPDNGASGSKKLRMPVLFSVFLDRKKIESGKTLVFTIDLAVKTTDYRISGNLFTRQRIPEENLFREKVTLKAVQDKGQWRLRYILTDEQWGENKGRSVTFEDGRFLIPLSSRKGFKSDLEVTVDMAT
ncbi:lipase family alpha/beta hydrolase [Natronogracilivirga saccharolytica]|uniref:GPI inositol-deacylase PGAP1-like alpha/beta domain-containing protein n=1 Tax=Natronogracilivirga saccharolytica TaxID=2812953 RepID=A0A8J7RL06_9BACT|nr:hypothetical protein [Natronogracilivirga saccharolytica]MBP3192765.1 hypothetical protein [Natronogracilivirga saccharolytica]